MFVLNYFVSIKPYNNGAIILNKKSNIKIELDEVSYNAFNMLISDDVSNLILFVMNTLKVDRQEAIKQINILRYTLYRNGIIEHVSKSKYFIKKCVIELTDVCNFRCPHCYVEKSNHSLPYQTIFSLQQELKRLGCLNVVLTGGETFLAKDFIKIYELLYDAGFFITLNTNGSILTNELAEVFSKKPPYAVEITIYGHNNESYKQFTKTFDDFNAIINNIQKLKNLNVNVILKQTITKSNISNHNKVLALAKKLDLETKFDFVCFPTRQKVHNEEQCEPDSIIGILDDEYLTCERYLNRYFNTSLRQNAFECRVKNDSLFVNSQGLISICPSMSHFSFEYKNGELERIINNLRGLLKIKKGSKCAKCRLVHICRYCPGKFYLEKGKYDTPPDWFCKFGNELFNKYIRGVKVLIKKTLTERENKAIFKVYKESGETFKDIKDFSTHINKFFSNPQNTLFVVYYDGQIIGAFENGNLNKIKLKQKYQTPKILDVIKKQAQALANI